VALSKKGIFCKRVPVGEAFVSLSDIPPVPAGSSPHVDAAAFPPRPGRFVLGSPPPGGISKCGPEQAAATVVRFQDADRFLYFNVAFGRHPARQLRGAVEGILNSVRVEPLAGPVGFPVTGRVLAATEHGGSLWVLTCDHGSCSGRSSSGRLQRLDPNTGRVGAMVQLHAPSGLAVDETGEWVFSISDGTVTHLDAAGNVLSVTQLELPTPIAGNTIFLPAAIAVGEGAVWVPSDVGGLARLDPSTGSVEQYIPLPPESFGGDLVTGFGSVWIVESQGLAQLDPATNQVVATIPITQNGLLLGPNEVAVAGGELWVTGLWAEPVTDEGGHPAFGATDQWGVASIDPTTGQVASITDVPEASALVAGAGRLWVVNAKGVPAWQVHDGRLARFSGLREDWLPSARIGSGY
jgi:streptogramin lyase